MPRLLLAASCLLLMSVLACGGGGGGTQPENLDAAAILQKSAAATATLKSFHFKLNHENGTTPMPLGLQLTSAEGDVGVPDRLQADVKAKAASITASVKVIGIGENTWITNPFSRRWQSLGGTSIKDIADPAALVNSMLASFSQPAITGQDKVGGTKTYHITGKIDAGALKTALSSAQPGQIASVDAWIGVSDSLPRKARISGRLSPSEPENIVREINLSKFNAPVDVQPPE